MEGREMQEEMNNEKGKDQDPGRPPLAPQRTSNDIAPPVAWLSTLRHPYRPLPSSHSPHDRTPLLSSPPSSPFSSPSSSSPPSPPPMSSVASDSQYSKLPFSSSEPHVLDYHKYRQNKLSLQPPLASLPQPLPQPAPPHSPPLPHTPPQSPPSQSPSRKIVKLELARGSGSKGEDAGVARQQGRGNGRDGNEKEKGVARNGRNEKGGDGGEHNGREKGTEGSGIVQEKRGRGRHQERRERGRNQEKRGRGREIKTTERPKPSEKTPASTQLEESEFQEQGRSQEGVWGYRSTPRRRPPSQYPRESFVEASPASPRGKDYLKQLLEYAARTGERPDLSCRPEEWGRGRCGVGRMNTTTVLHTLGIPDQDHVMPELRAEPEPYQHDDSKFNDVYMFNHMTTTGTRSPVLVIIMNRLYTGLLYKLFLETSNPITNTTGTAKQLIDFSDPPALEGCDVKRVGGSGSRFYARCSNIHGKYAPVYVQWSYHFQRRGAKTVFYHGTRPDFHFTLPSGLENNGYRMYVSMRAVDGKGVASKYATPIELKVKPRSSSGDGVLALFMEVTHLENESPPLLLQQVRSLAWELNLLTTDFVTQTVINNIYAVLFYASCKDSLATVGQTPHDAPPGQDIDLLINVNLLRSCARDHLAEIASQVAIRDEMEVLQVVSALAIIVDAKEFISSRTFTRVAAAMALAEKMMWWNYDPEVRAQAAKEYFVLASVMLDKQIEIYDWEWVDSLPYSSNLIDLVFEVMEGEIMARFLEEEPLVYQTLTLRYHGYLADVDQLNRWSRSVPFTIDTANLGRQKVYLVQSLIHKRSPYHVPQDPVASEVVDLRLHMDSNVTRHVTVKLPRSKLTNDDSHYDFRRLGILTPQSLSVYEFEVGAEQEALAFSVLLQVTRVFDTNNPVAAVLLICSSLQTLKKPLYHKELVVAGDTGEVKLSVAPGMLGQGARLLIIMDKNSWNDWDRSRDRIGGGEFKVSAWWSQCLGWSPEGGEGGRGVWSPLGCDVVQANTTWDITTCRCNSSSSSYGARSLPILTKESKMDVNELMLVKTYLALYVMAAVLVLYFAVALALHKSERHRLRRRNVWLRDNRPEHEWAYLLTIKTGTQWNAGTTSRVYAILHGTHGMSDTRELQSRQTGQLFTRGSLCTFILTTAEPLGDILKVQVWHDNSGRGSDGGWYVCETSVADLVLGARYAYPCYRWLAVHAEDATVEREITLETPTTFGQDFEHFLPQYASEHMLWTSLLTTSSTAKFYQLQRLTICLIVCLCLATISLGVVQCINREHTMMVPDLHIEGLYYGFMIAAALLPVQWLLEMLFKMSNRLEEKEYDNKSILDTLSATISRDEHHDEHHDEGPDDDTDEGDGEALYDPDARTWRHLAEWARTVELTNAHLAEGYLPLGDDEGTQVTRRMTRGADDGKEGECADLPPVASSGKEKMDGGGRTGKGERGGAEGPNGTAKASSVSVLAFLQELRKAWNYIFKFFWTRKRKERGRATKAEDDEVGWNGDEEEEDDVEGSDEDATSSSLAFVFSQCVGWVVCCLFAALCCLVLLVRGSRMPMDYCALWLHIIYMTLCYSMFLMQPLVVLFYTLYKVCMYRWLGCRGCISECVTVPLDQVAAIWTRYRTLLGRHQASHKPSAEKLFEERQRVRALRFAHPPSEEYLLGCRKREVSRARVWRVVRGLAWHLGILALVLIVASKSNILERHLLNDAVYHALENGTCLNTGKYLDACDGRHTPCNTRENEDYKAFNAISSKDDWWLWASSELLALTYTTDPHYTDFKVFCDTNSVLIGQPRLRKYDISSQRCEASKVSLSYNTSLGDLLRLHQCFPDYVDNATHVFGFGSDLNKEYEWDAHVLAVNHGVFSQYSYTHHQQDLPSSEFLALFVLMMLEASDWIDENATRAVVTEFTLYHHQTNLYTSVSLIAEFPSLSGAEVTTRVMSTTVQRYSGAWAIVCMMAEVVLVAVSLKYLYHSAIYVYHSQLRIWRCFWGLLDVCMTVLTWSYTVCLMLRVYIAEDVMWQLRVAYFQNFVNMKGLVTWDNVLEALVGGMVLVHTVRCLSLLRYLPRPRRLGLVMHTAVRDVLVITVMVVVLVVCFSLLGHLWFSSVVWEFHTLVETMITVLRITITHVSILPMLSEVNTEVGFMAVLGDLYYLVTCVVLYQLTRALYTAAFIHAYTTTPTNTNTGLNVSWGDFKQYAKEKGQALVRLVRRTPDTQEELQDTSPPDFYIYMAELEQQIGQIMGSLDTLAEALGVVMDRVAQLDEEEDPDDVFEDAQDVLEGENAWQAEGFPLGGVKSSTFKTELDHLLQPLQEKVREVLQECDVAEESSSIPELSDEMTTFDLDAFTDIASCQTEIEAVTRKVLDASTARTWTHTDGGQLAKFLKDVSAASDESLQMFGKYGKSFGKFKYGRGGEGILSSPSVRKTSASTDSSRLRSFSSYVDTNESIGSRPRTHTVAVTPSQQPQQDTQQQHGSAVMVGSRLRRTQTQGRGKGHVDILDIERLMLDSDDSD